MMEIWIRRKSDSEGAEGWGWEMKINDDLVGISPDLFDDENDAMMAAQDIVMELRRVKDVTFVLVVKE